jgi:hypothetical protein
VFQGLVLQLTWGEDVDLAASGSLIRSMIWGALFTDAARATQSA